MATVTPPVHTRSLDDSHRRVRSPLARLRGYIRTYVGLEGALVMVLFLALWFWVGLLLDYGAFKVMTVDWVQELPWLVRAFILVLLVAALITVVARKVLFRLLREFNDAALALVLERRFPRLLGDRLITAVELADTRKAEEQGYSAVMVQQTIHEAAERVEKLPLKEVFDWGRLIVRGVLAVFVTLGLYLLAGAAFLTLDSLWRVQNGRTGYSHFNETAGIWFERNVLLQNTIWPRRAQLELLNFPGSEWRVGQSDKAPALRIRALKYVVSGAPSKHAVEAYTAWLKWKGTNDDDVQAKVKAFKKSPPEGWRALTWFDLNKDLLGADMPLVYAPTDWNSAETSQTWATVRQLGTWEPRNPEAGLSIDEVEQLLQKEDTHASLDGDAHAALQDMVGQVESQAKQPSMSRVVRKLDLPETIYLTSRGQRTYMHNPLQKGADNEYVGNFGELKESINFTVQAEDYYTARRYVILVPPPTLTSLTSAESPPASLYYRPYDDTTKLTDLAGKKQPFEDRDVLQAGSDVSRITVPSGTDVVLTAKSDKDLKEVRIQAPKGAPELKEKADLIDKRSFRAAFRDVRQDVTFDFVFIDADGVQARRKVVIKPTENLPPDFNEVRVEFVRRFKQKGRGDHDDEFYMVTKKARIPFAAKVHATHALSDVRYRYHLGQEKAGANVTVSSALTVPAVPLLAPGGNTQFLAVAYLIGSDLAAARASEQELGDADPTYTLPRFPETLRSIRDDKEPNIKNEFLPMQTVKEMLAVKQRPPFRQLLRDFEVKPDEWTKPQTDPMECDFPLLNMKEMLLLDESHPHYRMYLRLEAADNDADGDKGPHVSRSKETFPFLIVSENELMVQIGVDEVKQFNTLDTMFQQLEKQSSDLTGAVTTVSDPNLDSATDPKVLDTPSTRAEKINEFLEKGQVTTREVYDNYRRILREEQLNQVKADTIERVERTIVTPLHDVVEFDYPPALAAMAAFRTALDDKTASLKDRVARARTAGLLANAQLMKLVADLRLVRDAMKGLTDKNILVQMLNGIETELLNQQQLAKALREKKEDDLFNNPDGKGPEKP